MTQFHFDLVPTIYIKSFAQKKIALLIQKRLKWGLKYKNDVTFRLTVTPQTNTSLP